MRIVVLAQHSQEWLDWRLGGIGSSDAMVIAAHHGMVQKRDWMTSLNALFEEKMSGVSKVVENARMRRGTENEAPARAKFEAMTGLVVQPLCAEMDENNQIRASFDGITFDGFQTNEIKCPDDKVHELAKAGEIVDYYVPQVVHQGLVAWGLPENWPAEALINFFSYHPETDDGALVVKKAIELRQFATELYQHEVAFLEMLKTGVPPCGAEFASLAARYLALDKQIEELEEAQEAYKKALTELAKKQGETVQGAGVSVVRVDRAGTVDWARLAAEYNISSDEVEKYRGQGKTSWQVRADRNAKVPESTVVPMNKQEAEQDVAGITDVFWGQFAQQAPTQRATHARSRKRPTEAAA